MVEILQEKKLWIMKSRGRILGSTGLCSCSSSRNEDKQRWVYQLQGIGLTLESLLKKMTLACLWLLSFSMHKGRLLLEDADDDQEAYNIKIGNKIFQLINNDKNWNTRMEGGLMLFEYWRLLLVILSVLLSVSLTYLEINFFKNNHIEWN